MDVSDSGAAQQKEDERHGVNNGSAGPSSSPTPAEISADKRDGIEDLEKEIVILRKEVQHAISKRKKVDKKENVLHVLNACRRKILKKERKECEKLIDKLEQKLEDFDMKVAAEQEHMLDTACLIEKKRQAGSDY